METIDLPQGTLSFRTFGPAGTDRGPVVLVHPILTDGELWQPVAERLADRGIRSYAPDWPLGSHTIPLGPGADRSPAGIARMISDFLAALDLEDVTLVGNDTGGALTQWVIDSGEPRVTRAVLVNCDAFDTFPPFPFNVVLPMFRLRWLGRLLAQPLRWRVLRHSWLGFGLLAHRLPADLTRAWIEPVRSDAGIRDDLAVLLGNVRPDDLLAVTGRLGSATVPVTVVWGMDDRVFRPALGRRLAAVTGTELVEVAGARTLLALDAPDALVEAIAEPARSA